MQIYKPLLNPLTPYLWFLLSCVTLGGCFVVNVAAPGPFCMGKSFLSFGLTVLN